LSLVVLMTEGFLRGAENCILFPTLALDEPSHSVRHNPLRL